MGTLRRIGDDVDATGLKEGILVGWRVGTEVEVGCV